MQSPWLLATRLRSLPPCRGLQTHTKGPGEAQDREVRMQKGNKTPPPGHSLGRHAPPPQALVLRPREGAQASPSLFHHTASFFVYQLSGSKVSKHRVHQTWLSPAMGSMLLALQGFNQ